MPKQLELSFDTVESEQRSGDHLGIPGLVYYRGLLNHEQQARILTEVDSRPWQTDLKRRVQHYGYKYDYKARKVDPSMYVGELPPFANEVATRLLEQQLITKLPDQLIINEYEPGQGITPHIDCEPCFEDTIVTVSLSSVYEMEFICAATKEVRALRLELGSALVLSGEARYKWLHCIKARRTDHGTRRGRRVSLTFRNVILEGAQDPRQ